MIACLILLCGLCVVLIAMNGWLFGKNNDQKMDIEKLYDAVATLSKETADLRKGMAAMAATQEEAAENIAKQVEKKWDSGLQNMLAWNPFDQSESEGK